MAASPAAYGSRESAANESVLECDPSPEPIRHRPVARSIIAAPCSNLPLCGFESYRLEIDATEGAEAHSWVTG